MFNPKLLEAATKITGIGDKIKSKLLIPYEETPGDSWMVILKHDGRSNVWYILAVVQNYGLDFDEFSNRAKLSYATTATNFGTEQNLSFGDMLDMSEYIALMPQGDIFSTKEGGTVEVQSLNFSYVISVRKTSEKFSDAQYSTLTALLANHMLNEDNERVTQI